MSVVFHFTDQNTVAWVNGEKITKDQVDRAVENSNSKDKKTVFAEMVNYQIIKSEAEKRGIKPQKEDRYKNNGGLSPDLERFVGSNELRLSGEDLYNYIYYQSKLADEVSRYVKGEMVFANMTDYLSDDLLDKPDEAKRKLAEDKTKTEAALKDILGQLGQTDNPKQIVDSVRGSTGVNTIYVGDFASNSVFYYTSAFNEDLFFETVQSLPKDKWSGPLDFKFEVGKMQDERLKEIAENGFVAKGLFLFKIKDSKTGVDNLDSWLADYIKVNVKYNSKYQNEYF